MEQNKRSVPKLIVTVFSMILIGIVLYGMYIAIRTITSLENELVIALLVAATTVLGAVIPATMQWRSVRRQEIEQRIRESKLPIYQKFVEDLLNFLWSSKRTGKVNTEQALAFFEEVTPQILLWASPEIIKAWATYRLGSFDPSLDKIEQLYVFEDVLFLIREDIGHKDAPVLKEGDILRLFVNDVDKHPRPKSK